MRKLLGEYECKIDDKGRMRMPSGLISQLGEREQYSFIMNRGIEKCLMLYPSETWERISDDIDQLDQFEIDARRFQRYFLRGAQEVVMDNADRILINKRLMEWAGIEKEVILLGLRDRIEIWSLNAYDELINEEPADMGQLTQKVMSKKQRESGSN
jgi:MraZ protein